ncbi:MAG TPA: hypothetical protein PLD54_02140 [Candidatus Levybacteria bacterium]|nr:hypothetical protein [Candidatus Levybacteria bacterium]
MTTEEISRKLLPVLQLQEPERTNALETLLKSLNNDGLSRLFDMIEAEADRRDQELLRPVPQPGEDPILDKAFASHQGCFVAQIQPLSPERLNDPATLQEMRDRFLSKAIRHGYSDANAETWADTALASFVNFLKDERSFFE